jgi:N-acyl-L-homoserine lactone synthetase
LIAKSAPIRFAVAQTPAERALAYHLRYIALRERNVVGPADFPDEMEYDAHDERAIQVLGWDGEQAMATGRLVLPMPGYLLPTEQSFDLVIEPQGEIVDIGRFTVLHAYAQRENRYFAGLLSFCWLEMRARGYLHVCGTASPGMLRHYRRIGFLVADLAAPHTYYGEERYPCRFDVIGSANVLLGKWSA